MNPHPIEIIKQTDRPAWLQTVVLIVAALSVAYCLGVVPEVSGQTTTPGQQPAASDESPAQKYFTDVVLINQNGEKMRLYSDLLKNKVVVINSFFGTCQASCLPLTRNLAKLQAALSAGAGKDVTIISISVDSTMDTPARLKEYATKLNARPVGISSLATRLTWTLLCGSWATTSTTKTVTSTLSSLAMNVPEFGKKLLAWRPVMT